MIDRFNNDGYCFLYKITNFLGETITLKNKLGMNTEIKSLTPDRRFGEEVGVFLKVTVRIPDLFKVTFNNKPYSNKLDQLILNRVKEIVLEKRSSRLNSNEDTHYNVNIEFEIAISNLSTNFKRNGYVSDALGFTLEKQEDAPLTFYKEEIETDKFKELKIKNGTFTNDTIFSAARLYDKEAKIGDLYTVIYGNAIRILPQFEDRPDGLELFTGPNLSNPIWIPMEEITEDVLKRYGFYKTEIEAYKGQDNNKHYMEICKEKETLKKTIKDLKSKIDDLNNKLEESKYKIKELETDKKNSNFIKTINDIKNAMEKKIDMFSISQDNNKKIDELNRKATNAEKINQNKEANFIVDFAKGVGAIALLFSNGLKLIK